MGDALYRTKTELLAAGKAIAAMRSAERDIEYREAWQHFLDRLQKVWKMAEAECKEAYGQAFYKWRERYKRGVTSDELLRYLHHARNADQHTVQRVMLPYKGFNVEVPPGERIPLATIDGKENKITFHLPVTFSEGYVLLPVKDRGHEYLAPRFHLGEPFTGTDPLSVAEAGLAYYTSFVADLERQSFVIGA